MLSLLIFILLLVALIWVHELGHFSAAKLFGVRVDEFAIGFPPRLLRVRWGETDYTFNLLLLGGFVRIYGEDPGEGGGDPSRQGEAEVDPRSLGAKNRGIQALIIAAGIIMNLFFGWLTLSAGYAAGMPAARGEGHFGTVTNSRPTIVGVLPGSPAQKAGLLSGDVVEVVQTQTDRLDVRTLNTDQQAQLVTSFIVAHQDDSIVLTVLREGSEQTFLAKGVEGLIEGRKAIGIQLGDIGILRLPPHLALLEGAAAAKDMTTATAQGLGSFFYTLARGTADWSQVSGPVGIAGAGSHAVASGFASAATVVALISINLALINVLPIPGLDGGRLFIILIEAVIRRPLPARFVTWATLAGFALIVALMLAVTYHDIAKLVG